MKVEVGHLNKINDNPTSTQKNILQENENSDKNIEYKNFYENFTKLYKIPKYLEMVSINHYI